MNIYEGKGQYHQYSHYDSRSIYDIKCLSDYLSPVKKILILRPKISLTLTMLLFYAQCSIPILILLKPELSICKNVFSLEKNLTVWLLIR